MLSVFIPLGLFSLVLSLTSEVGAVTWEGVPAGYGLAWNDEFGGAVGSAPNSSNWYLKLGTGISFGDGGLELNTNNIANAHVVADPTATDGQAMAIILIDTMPGSTNYTAANRYTTARIETWNEATNTMLAAPLYGYFESRIRIPYGQGIGAAFWMIGSNYPSVGWPACGEVDILENGFGGISDAPNDHSTLHFPTSQAGNFMGLLAGQKLKDDYHIYSTLVQNNQIQFFLDGNLFNTLNPSNIGGTWAFNVADFMILASGVGGADPVPNATTSFPATMFVDYVRVYQTGKPTPAPGSSSTWRVNCGGPSTMDGSGNVWAADTNFTGGWPEYGTSAISGTTDSYLYQFGRTGNTTGGSTVTYTFNVPAGSYLVTLKFAERYWTAAGQRVFNVNLNGTTVLPNFDIYSDAGGINKADDKTFTATPNVNGQIVIQLVPGSASYPSVGAIQIVPAIVPTNTPTNTPTGTLTPSLTPTPTFTPTSTFTWTLTPTITFTPTMTPTVTTISIFPAYPNPSRNGSPILINIQSPANSTAHWELFTTAFRKIREGQFPVSGAASLQWDLTDRARTNVAWGLYYLRLEVEGGGVKVQKIQKLEVLP